MEAFHNVGISAVSEDDYKWLYPEDFTFVYTNDAFDYVVEETAWKAHELSCSNFPVNKI